MKYIIILLLFSNTLLANTPLEQQKQQLGQKLFFDPILSKNQTQSCATCHNPAHGFVDNRRNFKRKAVSLGDDGKSFGTRNAPTAGYAKFSPNFHFKDGEAIGGQFLDGREKDLSGQAGGPPLNPVEMNMPSKQSIITRLKNNTDYNARFKQIFGENVFEDIDSAYKKMTDSIEAFEKTKFFSSFDSKYDRYLRGEYQLSRLEDLGKSLFFSNNNTNCASCHKLKSRSEVEGETFSSYQYHNIGVPKNPELNNATDFGLFNHTQNPKDKGKFKVPTLRNIAITGPYMHNGVFKNLFTVVKFYDKYLGSDMHSQMNPEGHRPWGKPEVNENISLDILQKGKRLDGRKIQALVAFLRTLTDKKFEHLIHNNARSHKPNHRL